MTEEKTVAGFLAALGSSAPAPGGGAASAAAGALAAALTEMVAQLTVGRPRFAAVEERARAVLDQAQAARARLLALMNEDAAAFEAVSRAYRLPKTTDDERAHRDTAIQEALAAAMEPPFAIMEQALDVLALAGEIAEIGNATVASDAGCAAVLADAAIRAGGLNVLANVASLHDAIAAAVARERVLELERAGADRERAALVTVWQRMGMAPAPNI